RDSKGPVSCLHSGSHLHSLRNITHRTKQAQQLLCSSYLCQTPCSLPTDSLSRTSCARQPAHSPTLPTDFPTWTPGVNLLGTNPHIYDRTSQPFSDQHQFLVPAPTSTSLRLAPVY
ncbi:hypothetical protein ATANTOWER_014491, partial [Ataeniobius toweri]|nr:hypothetical protein [Ataeniobius toweri]